MARKAAKTTSIRKIRKVEEFDENDEIIEEAVVEVEEYVEESPEEENEEELEEKPEEAITTTTKTRITTTRRGYDDEEDNNDDNDDDDDDVYNDDDDDDLVYDTENISGSIQPEAIFYKAPAGNYNEGTIYGKSKCEHISNGNYQLQGEYYTQQQLEQLSSEIRRHPNIASKSYHFLSLGLSSKIKHQWIRIFITSVILFSLIVVIFCLPLPHIQHIVMSPTGPSIQTTSNLSEFDQFDNPKTVNTLTAFKDNWRRFTIFGVSNFLCSNYNFNPLDYGVKSDKSETNIPKEFSSIQELKNLKIFGACILFGVILFIVWLIGARLAEREIIIKSNLPLQFIHSLITLIIIPILTMILLSLLLLYFIQTVYIGTKPNGQEDVFYCVSHLSTTLGEISTFSPIRELFLGSVGIIIRLSNYFYPLSIESLALHESTIIDRDVYQMKVVSFLWSLIVGSSIYHLIIIITYLYSIFHEYPLSASSINQQQHPNRTTSLRKKKNRHVRFQPTSNEIANSTGTIDANLVAGISSDDEVEIIEPSSFNLLFLDLKFIPSFIPEVLLTQNFVIVFIWLIAASILWVFGIPPNLHIHEGELFYIFLSLAPLLKSIYNLVVIEQKKDKIISIHNKNTWKSEPELLEQQ